MFYASLFPSPKDKSLCTSLFNLFIHTIIFCHKPITLSQYNVLSHPKVPFSPTSKFRFSSSRNNFFLPSHQSIIRLASALLPSCFHPAFASPSSSLHPFFIPSFPFLEALAQEELTKGFIKGKYTANLQRTQRQQPAAPKFKNMQLIIR